MDPANAPKHPDKPQRQNKHHRCSQDPDARKVCGLVPSPRHVVEQRPDCAGLNPQTTHDLPPATLQQIGHGFRCHHQSRAPGPAPPSLAISRYLRCSQHWKGARPPAQGDAPYLLCLHKTPSHPQDGTHLGGDQPDHPCCWVDAFPVPPTTRRDNGRGGLSPATHRSRKHPRSRPDCYGAVAWDCWSSVLLDATV